MEIIKNDPKHEIVSFTQDSINKIAHVARTCYDSFGSENNDNNIKLVRHLIARGHDAMLEMAEMTVKFTNVSRGFTHELVRHRMASFAQQSTRYVKKGNFRCIVPPNKDEKEKITVVLNGWEMLVSVEDWFKMNEQMYCGLLDAGWKPEDARQVLPTAIDAPINISANFREWRHIFKLRTSPQAHWEIREAMTRLLNDVKYKIPLIFEDIN